MPWNGDWLVACECCHMVETSLRKHGKAICAVCRWFCQTHEYDGLCVIDRLKEGWEAGLPQQPPPEPLS